VGVPANFLSMENDRRDMNLIPRGTVFAEAARRGLAPSDDRFDRFRASGLITDLAAIKGSNQRGFTPYQAQRFLDLLTLCKKLGTKRPRASALAFWLCWYGATDIPPELVCVHSERSVCTYLHFLGRQYDRRRVPSRSHEDPERWRKAGMPWAKPFIKEVLQSFIDNGMMLDILSTIVGLVLRALFSKTSFEVVAPTIKRLAFLLGIKEIKMEAIRKAWDVIEEGLQQLLTVDERRNPLLVAVREIKANNPHEIIGLVHDTRRTIAAMGHIFPIYRIPAAPEVADPKSDVSKTLARLFPPGITAVLALTRNEPHAIAMRENMRRGNFDPVLQEFYQVRVLRDSIIARISKEQKQ
jgi:hypothetical protein